VKPILSHGYLKAGHRTLNIEGLSFRFLSSKNKSVKVSGPRWRDTQVKRKNLSIRQSLVIPRFTRTVKVYKNRRLVSVHTFRKATHRKSFFGAVKLSKVLGSGVRRPSALTAGLIPMLEHLKAVLGEGYRIESGYLPTRPFVKNMVFVNSNADYKRRSKRWRYYVAIEGEAYKAHGGDGDDLGDGDEAQLDGMEGVIYHLVSIPQDLTARLSGSQVVPKAAFLMEGFVEDIVEQHNIRLKNRQVKTRWFGGYRFLGVERL